MMTDQSGASEWMRPLSRDHLIGLSFRLQAWSMMQVDDGFLKAYSIFNELYLHSVVHIDFINVNRAVHFTPC